MRIRLNNFRCFVDSGSIQLRPITFLIGENSAGKTTFLAGLRYLLESFSGHTQNPFNKDPYYLGGFDQIAHYRRGKTGRAKQFSLSIDLPKIVRKGNKKELPPTSHCFYFAKGAIQPELSQYVFSSADALLKVTFGEKATFTYAISGQAETTAELDDASVPTELLKADPTFITFALRNHSMRFRSENTEENFASFNGLIEQFSASLNAAKRRVFASSPVRTQPLRTYTPAEINASSEGAHVPLEMAQQKIAAPLEWKIAHDKLAAFGKEAGLFEDIDIRHLGKKDGDPFQVTVRGNGPPVNLVDVGYGVSQALPIIYQLEQARGHNTFLLQQPEVHLHPRAQAEIGSLVARLSRDRPDHVFVLETHSDYILDRVRMKVAQGALNKDNVTIAYFEKGEHEVEAKNLYLSESGEIVDPPAGFRNFFLEEQARLLGI